MLDFLVVATRLLLLKSRSLLPQFSPEEDEGPGLEEQLKLYKQFLEASKQINQLWLDERHSRFRIQSPKKSVDFVAPANLTIEALQASMVQLVGRLKPAKPLPQTSIDRTVSIKEKISQIRNLLKRKKD